MPFLFDVCGKDGKMSADKIQGFCEMRTRIGLPLPASKSRIEILLRDPLFDLKAEFTTPASQIEIANAR